MEEVPNIWPEGGVFTLCETEHTQSPPLLLTGVTEGIGWHFPFEPEFSLVFDTGDTKLRATRYTSDVCLPDCWRILVQLGSETGTISGGFVDGATLTLQAHFPGLAAPSLVGNPQGTVDGDVTLCSGPGWWVAVVQDTPEVKRRIGIAVSFESVADATDRARKARNVDVEGLLAARAAWQTPLAAPESMLGNNRRLYVKAAAVLRAWMHRPESPGEHALEQRALGLQHLDMEQAYRTYQRAVETDRPANRERRGGALPLLAWTYCQLHDWAESRERLESIYPALVTQVQRYELQCRNATGLFNWSKAREDAPPSLSRSAPRLLDSAGHPSAAVDLSCAMACEYLALERIARALEKSAEANDWRARYTIVADLVNELLWDDVDRFYYDLDDCGEYVPLKRSENLLALLAHIPDRDRAESLRMHIMNPKEFWSPCPLPALSQDETPLSADEWAEPASPYINALVYHGLRAYSFHEEALALLRVTFAEMARVYTTYGCLYKRYDSMTALPPARLAKPARPDYPGTAAICLHLAHQMT